IEDSSALSRYIASKAPGSSVRLQVVRDGAPRTVSLTLGTFPDEDTRAEDAGLQRGDLIVSVNGQEVDNVEDFDKEIAKAKGDGLARLRVRRGNTHTFLILKLG